MKAALFDLDGVILDTETQYTQFWGSQCRHYFPTQPGLENTIKGQTLTQIYQTLFANHKDQHTIIKQQLDHFEQQMQYNYITGFPQFITHLRQHHIPTAIVTSSNNQKMANVHHAHPELQQWFDTIITAEHITHSKPHPDPYLKAAQQLGIPPHQCVGFEDSINGLKSLRSAGMKAVALATTNPPQTIAPLANIVINNFHNLTLQQLLKAGF